MLYRAAHADGAGGARDVHESSGNQNSQSQHQRAVPPPPLAPSTANSSNPYCTAPSQQRQQLTRPAGEGWRPSADKSLWAERDSQQPPPPPPRVQQQHQQPPSRSHENSSASGSIWQNPSALATGATATNDGSMTSSVASGAVLVNVILNGVTTEW